MTPPTDATATGLKEAIARVIDPEIFAEREAIIAEMGRVGMFYSGQARLDAACDRADAILALLPSAAVGGEREGEVERPSMTGDEWRALPENARRYIHMLETDADPSGTIRFEMILRDYVELLEARLNETNGCFDAAVCEGLYECLQEAEPDNQAYARLVDLVERRLLYAYAPTPDRPSALAAPETLPTEGEGL